MKRAICTVVVLLGALMAWPSPAGAQTAPACTSFGSPIFTLPTTLTGNFAVGESLRVNLVLHAGQPATRVLITVNGGFFAEVELTPAEPTETVSIPVEGAVSVFLFPGLLPGSVTFVGVSGSAVLCPAAAYPLSASAPQSATDALSPVSLPEIDRVSNLPRLAAVVAFALIVNGVAITAVRRRRRIPSLGEPSPS